jgi:hypothetical protein
MSVLRVLNLKQSGKIDLPPESIPDLVPAEILAQWKDGDTNPFYKLQKIEYPIKANGLVYKESFFESYISKLKERPIPGAKSGHEMAYGKRAPTDFILIGAKIEKKGNGEGVVYLKNYIPPAGDSGDNKIFIRENKSDMIHFSVVSYVKEEIEETPDGNIYSVIESLYGERNDAVEYGTGAMKQITNKDDLNVPPESDELEDKSIKKESNLTKEELIKSLQAIKANAVSLSEMAEVMGQQDQIVTDKHLNAVKIVDELTKLDIKDPINYVKSLQETIKANAESVRNAELDKAFGGDVEGKNVLRQYAGKQTEGLIGEKLENKIKELKDDPIAQALAARLTDYTTDENTIGKVEPAGKQENADKYTGVVKL